jgi:hypothetical protein
MGRCIACGVTLSMKIVILLVHAMYHKVGSRRYGALLPSIEE